MGRLVADADKRDWDELTAEYGVQLMEGLLLAGFSSLLPPGGDVLDIGCGAGVPVARFLVRAGFKVTGVDVSSSMLELARVHVPEANFVKMDMRQLEFDADCFDGICAFYSLFHVPREEHLQVLIGFNRLLRQDGILLFSSGRDAWSVFWMKGLFSRRSMSIWCGLAATNQGCMDRNISSIPTRNCWTGRSPLF